MPDPAREAIATLDTLISERFSCRGFQARHVPHGDILRVLEMAQKSASWCNSQPWEVIITEGAETNCFRDALYARATSAGWADQKSSKQAPDFPFPARYEGIYKTRQRETGWALYESVGVTYGDREASGRQLLENFRLFGAPHVAIITTEQDLGVYGAVDCGAYLANFMLAAQSLGIATIAQAAIAGMAGFVREYFDVPDNRLVLCGISFGYADPDHPANSFRTTREEVGRVARFVGAPAPRKE